MLVGWAASRAAMLFAWQGVVYERPPAGTLQRGVFAVPRAPAVALVLAAVVALLAWTLRTRLRRRP